MTIRGTTSLVAHIGFPTHSFVSPLIYNPYFEQAGIDAVVVPMGCRPEHFPECLAAVFRLTNVRGALITMPHKMTTVALLDEASPAVRLAGSCNAVRRTRDGRLEGDLFDGEGFVRALRGKGCGLEGARAFVAGAGGVGSAIAASLAAAGAASIACATRARAPQARWPSVSPRPTRTSCWRPGRAIRLAATSSSMPRRWAWQTVTRCRSTSRGLRPGLSSATS